MNFETMSNQRKMILIAAAVGLISMFLPWWSFIVNINGMRGWGLLTFFGFVVAGALAFMGDQTTNLNQTNWMIVLIAGGVAALSALIYLLNSPFGISPSYGLYIALAAAIAITAFTFMHRSSSDSLQGGFDNLKGEIKRKMNSTNSGSTTTATGTTTTVNHTPTDEPNRPTV